LKITFFERLIRNDDVDIYFEVDYLATLSESRLSCVAQDDRMFGECGAVGEMIVGKENRSTRRNPTPCATFPTINST
jgi:hypothetical protein